MPDESDFAESGNSGTPVAPDETIAGETAALGREGSRPSETLRRPPVEPESPREVDDGTPDASGPLRRCVAALARVIGEHRLGAAAAALLVVATVIVAVALTANRLPSRELVEQDALSRLETPAYASGSFGRDDILVAREAEVRSVTPGEDADHALAEVLVTYSGSYVRAERSATLAYVRSGDGWAADGEPIDPRVSWEALAGPDPSRIAANVGVLLAQADRQLAAQGDEGGVTLEQLYAGTTARVDRLEYDPESGGCSVEVVCTRTEAFESYECRLSAGMAFRSSNGQWEVERLSVSDGGKARSLEPLVGTWRGTFAEQRTDGTKCLAGRVAGLELDIEGTVTKDGVSQVSGTVTGVAHYHEHPERDAESCEGDLELDAVPFTATLVSDEDGTLVLEATLPEDLGGSATLTLVLDGTGGLPTATAELSTSYRHKGSILFFPIEQTLTYTDVFSLVRADSE